MFELYQPMNTHMERISAILELRRGKIDSLFEVQWPIEVRKPVNVICESVKSEAEIIVLISATCVA